MDRVVFSRLADRLNPRLKILEAHGAQTGGAGDPVVDFQIEDVRRVLQELDTLSNDEQTDDTILDQEIQQQLELLRRRYGVSKYLELDYYYSTPNLLPKLNNLGDEQIIDILVYLQRYRRRLEEQRAIFNFRTPPDIIMEIQDIMKQFEELQVAIPNILSEVDSIAADTSIQDLKDKQNDISAEAMSNISTHSDYETIEQYINLIKAYYKRLRALEIQKTEYGINADASIFIEIEDIQANIKNAMSFLDHQGISSQVIIRDEDQIAHERSLYKILTRRLKNLKSLMDATGENIELAIINEISDTESQLEALRNNFIKPEEEYYNQMLEVLSAKKNRLFSLEIRSALSGSSTFPEVVLEASEIRKEIAALEDRFLPDSVSANVQERIAQLREVIEAHTRRKEGLQKRIERVYRSLAVQMEIELEDIDIKIEDINKQIKRLESLSPSIFVSYSRSDWEEYVQPLVNALRRSGFKVWVDQHLIEGGRNWWDEVDDALRSHQYMVLCVSPQAIKSTNVKNEYRFFISKSKPVFPVIFRTTDLPNELLGIEYFLPDQVDRLIYTIRNLSAE